MAEVEVEVGREESQAVNHATNSSCEVKPSTPARGMTMRGGRIGLKVRMRGADVADYRIISFNRERASSDSRVAEWLLNNYNGIPLGKLAVCLFGYYLILT